MIGKIGIFGKMIVFSQGCCIRTRAVLFWQKILYLGKSGCIRAKMLYSGETSCIRAKLVVFGQKLLHSGKKLFYSGKSGSIWAKAVVFG